MTAEQIEQIGKYEVIARIARGGMAEIFLARQPGLGGFSRRVVIKCILPFFAKEKRFVDMFLEEARLASLIHHPNVVQIFDVGEDGETYFLAMEFIDGLDVNAMLEAPAAVRKPLPVEVAGEIVAQACAGLHAAHTLCGEDGDPLNIVHRDVSPQNLMVTRDGVVKVLDFGIAKAQGSGVQTKSGTVKGKFAYMSPEQARSHPLDCRSDVFAMGSVLHELLTGESLFSRGNELATMQAIVKGQVPAPHEVNPEVPSELSEVCLKALRRDRDQRTGSAAELATELRAALGRLGHYTSPETLARFLEEGCEAQLRSRRIERMGLLTPGVGLAPLSSSGESGVGQAASEALGLEESDTVEEAPAFSPSGEVDPLQLTAPEHLMQRQLERAQEEIAAVGAPLPEAALRSERPPPRPGRSAARADGRGRPRWLILGLVIGALVGIGAAFALGQLRRGAAPAQPPLTLGHPPAYSPEVVSLALSPLSTYLGEKLGRPVEVSTTQTYSGVIAGLGSGELHLALLSPLLLVEARAKVPGLSLLAAVASESDPQEESLIVTRSGADIRSVEQLRPHSLCYPDRRSTVGFLLPRRFLRRRGLDPDRLFSKAGSRQGQAGVLTDVIGGRCEAGVVGSVAWFHAGELGIEGERLRLVTKAGESPREVLCASPMVAAALVEELRAALLDFRSERDLGAEVAPSSFFAVDRFVPVDLESIASIEAAARAEALLE